MQLSHSSIKFWIFFFKCVIEQQKQLFYPFKSNRYIYLSVVQTNMIIYPKVLVLREAWDPPSNRHKWNLSQENEKRSKCLCWWLIVMNKAFFVNKIGFEFSFVRELVFFLSFHLRLQSANFNRHQNVTALVKCKFPISNLSSKSRSRESSS